MNGGLEGLGRGLGGLGGGLEELGRIPKDGRVAGRVFGNGVVVWRSRWHAGHIHLLTHPAAV